MTAGNATTQADGKTVLVLHEAPEQHAALQALLRFMYCADMEAAVAADPLLLCGVREAQCAAAALCLLVFSPCLPALSIAAAVCVHAGGSPG